MDDRISTLTDDPPAFAREFVDVADDFDPAHAEQLRSEVGRAGSEAGSIARKAGVARAGGRGRKPPPPPKLLDSGDGPPDLVLGDIPRGERARLYVSVGEFAGKLRVGLRVWRVMPKSGEDLRPTNKGLVVWPDELDRVIAALTEARRLIVEKRPEALSGPPE